MNPSSALTVNPKSEPAATLAGRAKKPKCVVAEALTNVAKHARAAHAAVTARVTDGALVVQVRDDGIGGARADGTGLLGLRDRLAAFDGRLRVESPADGGTLVDAYIPLSGNGGDE